MKQLLRSVFLGLIGLGATQQLHAQFYSWGADRASLRWSSIERSNAKIIYPDSVEHTARRMMHYLDAVQTTEAAGFKYPALDIPFVVHPDNFASNGMVMWAPIRVEFLSTPAVSSYSMPWVKQLIAHEYRHAVQYSNLDRSTLKVFRYILGEQSAAASLLYPPLYAIEGDAVMIETDMSSYGRGLQPSFTIGYRAQGDAILNRKDFLKWRCGSYREHIPDHYRMGYQMMSYAYTRYDENILDRTFAYTTRNPQVIIPYAIALKKFYGTSSKKLFYDSFAELVGFWKPLAEVENSATQLSSSEDDNYITYSSPTSIPSGEILALKADYKNSSRFVIFNPATSTERVVAHTGAISTRPAYAAGRIWWSEYRTSPLFSEDVNSQLCYMDIEAKRPRHLKGRKSGLYPTPIGESKDHIAYVEYNPNGQYSIVELVDNQEVSRKDVEYPHEVHGMAWDRATDALYILVTGDDGMWIERVTSHKFERITKAAYTTLSSLSAHDGVLYFGSIASGKDEIHSFDLASGIEHQLTESTYGAFDPSHNGDELLLTIYDKYGYHLAHQANDVRKIECHYSAKPKNLVNPERKRYDVVNLDTVRFDSTTIAQSEEQHKPKKYHKAANLINIHSWAPARYNPFSILNEQSLDIGLGATIMSQNLLSSCEGYLSYGWDHYQGSVLQTGISYNGLGAKIDLAARYGGEQNLYLIDIDVDRKKYKDLSLSVSLPLHYSRGYHNRIISVYGGWNYSNGIVPRGLSYSYGFIPAEQKMYTSLSYKSLSESLNKLSLGISYTSYVNKAPRDLVTPLGYSLSASYASEPLNNEFSQLMSLYAKVYTPGVAENNSFTIAAAYQNAIGGFKLNGYRPLSFLSSALIPHGYNYLEISNNKYIAASANYSLPICYPEIGILDAIYIKRLSLAIGADYASFNKYMSPRSTIYSYGATIMTDFNAISLSAASTLNLSLSLYKPSNKAPYFQFGFGLPF